MSGKSFIVWDFHDHAGARVAGGLYYLRLEVVGTTQKTMRILKVIVLP